MHDGTLYERLDATSQACIDGVTSRYRCTVQEVRELCEAARDLVMWGEPGIDEWWAGAEAAGGEAAVHLRLNPRERKKRLIAALREHMQRLRSEPTRYDRPHPRSPSGNRRSPSGRRRSPNAGEARAAAAAIRRRARGDIGVR